MARHVSNSHHHHVCNHYKTTMNPNIARNCKSFHFRKATAHDAVVIERGESKDGSPFIVMEKVNHPILVLHRDFEYPEPSRRDKGGNMILPPLGPIDWNLMLKYTGSTKQWVKRGIPKFQYRINRHNYRMHRQKVEGQLRRQGIHCPTRQQVDELLTA